MGQQFANAARAELAQGIGAQDTTFYLAGGGGLFPPADTGQEAVSDAKDWFKAVLQDADGIEIVHVRTHARGAGTFSHVVRGQEGTTARPFNSGAVIGLRQTAADMAAVFAGMSGVQSHLEAVHGPARAIELLLMDDERSFAAALSEPGNLALIQQWMHSLCGLREGLQHPLVFRRLLGATALQGLLTGNSTPMQLLLDTPHAWRAATQSESFMRAVLSSETAMRAVFGGGDSVWDDFLRANLPAVRNPKMTGPTAPSGKASASSESAGGGKHVSRAWFAMDDAPLTQWSSATKTTQQWLEYEFAQPVFIHTFELEQASDFAQKVKAQYYDETASAWLDASATVDAPQQAGAAYAIRTHVYGRHRRWRLLLEPTTTAFPSVGVRQMTLKGFA